MVNFRERKCRWVGSLIRLQVIEMYTTVYLDVSDRNCIFCIQRISNGVEGVSDEVYVGSLVVMLYKLSYQRNMIYYDNKTTSRASTAYCVARTN